MSVAESLTMGSYGPSRGWRFIMPTTSGKLPRCVRPWVHDRCRPGSAWREGGAS